MKEMLIHIKQDITVKDKCKNKHEYVFVGLGKDTIDHYTYICFRCKNCGEYDIRNKQYYKTYDEGVSD